MHKSRKSFFTDVYVVEKSTNTVTIISDIFFCTILSRAKL